MKPGPRPEKGSRQMKMNYYKRGKSKAKAALSTALALIMVCGLSVASFAYNSRADYGLAAVAIKEEGAQNTSFGLDVRQILVRREVSRDDTSKIVEINPLALGTNTVFNPGDAVLIPMSFGTYGSDGTFLPKDGNSLYFQKGIPENWRLTVTEHGDSVLEEARWYIGPESGVTNTLFALIPFQKTLVGSQKLSLKATVTVEDIGDGSKSNSVELLGSFENRSKEASPSQTNIIESPMTLVAGEAYQGEPLTLSFAGGVLFSKLTMRPGQTAYLNLDRGYDSQLANSVKVFDMQYYNFWGNGDSFPTPGVLTFPTEVQEPVVYEIENGMPRRLVSQYDEESGTVSISTDELGYYVVSPTEWR